ncbi:hypothetical protein EYC80_004595 [Monilinia laxa]|uniref:DUF7918 domain-containing protein n=1 Tax=Monilinia laxa TaxID=61186 RepID=A0A5N6KH97_MONLA|nr:hypothetical protein EYC80_004595 [Monilinia laxa]
MAYTFASPCRSVCHGLTDFHFDDEQSNATADQGSEYDADVKAAGVEYDEPHCKATRSIASPTQVTIPPVITWQTVNTTSLGATRVEIAEAHIFAQANIIDSGHWHAVRTSQIEPRQSTHPRLGGWAHVNISPTRTLQINITDTKPSTVEDTQAGIVGGNECLIPNGLQANNSQATIGGPDKPSCRYLKMSNNLPLRLKKIVRCSMKIGFDMPQLKATFRKYKKEYTSAATIEQVNCIRYRILHLGAVNKDKENSEMADIESEWDSLWERRRWLKREMLRIKGLYTSARCRRQERIRRQGHNLTISQSSYLPKVPANNTSQERMAILPGVPYIRVRVLTGGLQSVEYDDPVDAQDGIMKDIPQNKISVYIESKTNQKFGFEYWIDSKKKSMVINDPDTCFGFYATIDGRGTSSVVVCNEDGFKPQRWTHHLSGERLRTEGDLRVRSFMFTDFNPRDDFKYAPLKVVSQLGELVVHVWRVRKCSTVPPPTAAVPAREVDAHESQVKGMAVSHTTEFGVPQTSLDREIFYKLEYIDPINKPLAEFHFKYRSREILEQIMIPPPASYRISTQNLDLASRKNNPLPRALTPPPPPEKGPSATGRDIIRISKSLTSREHNDATEMAIPRASTMNSVITGRSFNKVTGAFSSSPAPLKVFVQIAPPATTGSMITSIPTITCREAKDPVTLAFGSISQVAPSSFSKAETAMTVETLAKEIFRPDVKTLAIIGLRAAPETTATPTIPVVRAAPENTATSFTHVLHHDIHKNISSLRNIAKRISVVDVVEVQDQLSQVENEIRVEIKEQAKPEDISKRERVVEEEDDLEFVLERPVKRRHIFTEADEIIDLTAN